eukprot:RCo042563
MHPIVVGRHPKQGLRCAHHLAAQLLHAHIKLLPQSVCGLALPLLQRLVKVFHFGPERCVLVPQPIQLSLHSTAGGFQLLCGGGQALLLGLHLSELSAKLGQLTPQPPQLRVRGPCCWRRRSRVRRRCEQRTPRRLHCLPAARHQRVPQGGQCVARQLRVDVHLKFHIASRGQGNHHTVPAILLPSRNSLPGEDVKGPNGNFCVLAFALAGGIHKGKLAVSSGEVHDKEVQLLVPLGGVIEGVHLSRPPWGTSIELQLAVHFAAVLGEPPTRRIHRDGHGNPGHSAGGGGGGVHPPQYHGGTKNGKGDRRPPNVTEYKKEKIQSKKREKM